MWARVTNYFVARCIDRRFCPWKCVTFVADSRACRGWSHPSFSLIRSIKENSKNFSVYCVKLSLWVIGDVLSDFSYLDYSLFARAQFNYFHIVILEVRKIVIIFSQ